LLFRRLKGISEDLSAGATQLRSATGPARHQRLRTSTIHYDNVDVAVRLQIRIPSHIVY
jgi:hypothetical protein